MITSLKDLEKNKIVVIEESALRNILSMIRTDVAQKICSAKEAQRILSMSNNEFYKEIKKPECLIRPSRRKGKYVLSSIHDEADRQNKQL